MTQTQLADSIDPVPSWPTLFRQADAHWARGFAVVWASCHLAHDTVIAMIDEARQSSSKSQSWFHRPDQASGAVVSAATGTSSVPGIRQALKTARDLGVTVDGFAEAARRCQAGLSHMMRRRIAHERAAGHACLHRIVLENRGLIWTSLRTYVRQMPSAKADLEQVALQGLVRASQRFDVSRGYRFSTCAAYWCDVYLRRELDQWYAPVHASMADHQDIRRLVAILRRHGKTEVRSIDASWLVEQLELPKERIEELVNLIAINRASGSDQETVLGQIQASNDTQSEYETIECSDRVHQAIQLLDPRSRTILEMRFGIRGQRVLAVKDIATHLGISSERVRQLYKAALAELEEDGRLTDLGTDLHA